VRDAAFRSDWVGTPITFQRCLMFIIVTANKELQLTAGKFVPESKMTMLNIWSTVKVPVTNNNENVYSDIRQKVMFIVILYSEEAKLQRGFCKP